MLPSASSVGACLSVAASVCLLFFSVRGQQPQFRATTDLVVVDVAVIDKNRQPVMGLSQADFQVWENGRAQEIATFASFTLPAAARVSTSWPLHTGSGVIQNTFNDDRLIVLLMDDATAPADPYVFRSAREVGGMIVDRMGPADQAAVVFTSGGRRGQEFTRDRARLWQAIDNFGSNPGGPQAMVGTLETVAQHLGAIPSKRKVVFFLSAGMQLDLNAFLPMLASPAHAESGLGQREQSLGVLTRLIDGFTAASKSNVNFYAVDLCGLRPWRPLVPGGCYSDSRILDFFHVVSNETGGWATVNRNDFGPKIEQVFQENGAYYLLGYRSTESPEKEYRRIEVKVSRPDVEVRARKGYVAEPPAVAATRAAAAAEAGVKSGISGLLPDRGVLLQLGVASLADANDRGQIVGSLGVYGLADRTPYSGPVDVIAGVFDRGGREVASQPLRATLALGGSTDRLQREIVFRVGDLKSGRYYVRVGVKAGGVNGSVYADVDVPEFSKAPLELSGLFVEAQPGPVTVTAPNVRGVLPVSPTTVREFYRAAAVQVWMRVYQGGTRALNVVDLAAVLLDAQNRPAWKADARLDAGAFGAERAAEWRAALPIGSLEPGAYLLRVDARTGTRSPVVRDTVLTVR
jgi:VWFA-related protein